MLRAVELCFPTQGNVSSIEFETYLYYIKTRGSRPSQNVWVPFTPDVEKDLVEDFKRLWATSFLDDLAVEVLDTPYPNGVVGKYVRFRLEERQRVKIVEYVGSEKIEATKVDEKLREINNVIRLDSFIDPAQIRRVESVVREMLSEKGYLDGEVSHTVTPIAGGPKLVNLTFTIKDGPRVLIKDIDFIGNEAIGDGALKRRMKENKERTLINRFRSKGVYQQAKFEEDAENVRALYREEGYIAARVGQPEIKTLEASDDGKNRSVQLRIPVTEGRRYKVGKFAFEGNTVVKGEALQPIFKLETGDYYSEKKIRKGLEKARELYGTGGYFEFTGFPDLKPLDMVDPSNPDQFLPEGAEPNGPPVVDVTMRMQEGEQYFINRITFKGNTTTRDNVIRRELNLLEGGVFNTESLKNSVRRLNQLGYFKQLEEGQEGIDVKKTPGEKNKVDVTLALQEQNRNQLTFGAGVSQYEGFFGQLAFSTSNFLGRGETLSLSVAAGSRTQFYQVAFTEPYLFDRPITAGVDVSRRAIQYIGAFTQQTTGINTVWGFPLTRNFTRGFLQYSYEQVMITRPEPALHRPGRDRPQPVPAGRAAAAVHADAADRGRPGRRPVLHPGRGPHDQQGRPEPRAQHGRQPDLPEHGASLHGVDRPGRARRQHALLQAAVRVRPVPAAHAPDVVRVPVRDRVHPRLGRLAAAAAVRAPGARRRVQRARLRRPQHRSARPRDGRRARRQQEPAVQLRVPDQHRRAGAPGALLRCRPGPDLPAELRVGRVQDVDRRRSPVLHAGAERAVPPDLRCQPSARGCAPQRLHPHEGLPVPVCRGLHVLS